jgi:hypothetical protein
MEFGLRIVKLTRFGALPAALNYYYSTLYSRSHERPPQNQNYASPGATQAQQTGFYAVAV